MAKKVFRIHTEGALNNDWFPSSAINASLIASISTSGGDGKKLPTSIPSPFARIDLVRTAFATVGDSGQLDGIERNGKATGSDNHKLISDALDIGQILFNFNKHKRNLQLISWDKDTSLAKLKNGNAKQKHLGETLDLFLKQDSVQYNFDNFEKIYIIKFKNKIIGGTSPRTLFFAAPNVSAIDIKFGNDTMLDDGLNPLYKRDKEYIKYLYALSKTDNFNTYFREFNSYLIKNWLEIEKSDTAFYNDLATMVPLQYLNSLENVVFNNNSGQPLEVIKGIRLKQYVLDPKVIEGKSDFIIKTNKQISGLKPLVLPVSPLNLRYYYTLDEWNPITVVPLEDSRELSQRTLPEQGDQYPYLTMNDFFTDSIIKLPYEIDNVKFFTSGKSKYLLPLTKRFFEYFSVEDFKNGNLIKFEERGLGGVEINLNIPIKKGTIQYSKIYYPISNSIRDPKKGTIIEKSFAFSIYPFVYCEQADIVYSIGLADIMPNKSQKLNLSVFNTKETNANISSNQKERSESPFITSQTLVKDRFDAVAIQYGNVQNFIIPNWPKLNGHGGDNYEFAIDFGTTNSHIEYKITGQGGEKAFDITESDEQIAFLMPNANDASKRNKDIRDILDGESHLKQEVISKKFGKDEVRNAPFRTCIIQNTAVNYNQPTFIFADANAGFDYEKVVIRKYLKAFTDLKWANNGTENNSRLSLYIEELLVLCRNKILINNGNLGTVKVTWFYPVSMTSSHLNRLRAVWQKNFQKVFGVTVPATNLIDFPESIAPFYYYKANEGLKAMAKPSVSIDIGGGTTDIMIYYDGEPQLISSFRFAGNSIFGDGFNGNIKENGFVKKYYEEFNEILSQNNLAPELEIFEKIYNDNQSSQDLINFFFSLHENKNIRDKQLNNLNFSEKLTSDSDFKIIFLLFYAAIIYHIAELMKIKNLDTPRNIVFSGTGSKTLHILDQDTNRYSSLKKLFESIFNNVYDVNDSNIIVKASPNPKEVTCKGGFYIGTGLNNINHTDLVKVNVGNKVSAIVQSVTNVTADTIKYKHLDRTYYKGVLDNVNDFYILFNKLMVELNFRNCFGVSNKSIKVFNEIKSDDLIDFLMQGVDNLRLDTVEDDALGETLFFFPLIGKLNELATEIVNK